jgi:hypothetical protein
VLHARDPEVGQQAYLVDALTWQPVGTEESTEATVDTAATG